MFIYYYIYVDNALEKSTKQVSELTTKTQTKARPSPPELAWSKLEPARARSKQTRARKSSHTEKRFARAKSSARARLFIVRELLALAR